jgi:ubiquinone/menaquinone biosynthesis C-methylase UbiE
MDTKHQNRFDSDIAFHKKTASAYDYIAVEPRKVQLELLLRHIDREIQPGIRFLDLGCGTGHSILRYAHLFREVIGVDHSPEMLNIAAKHLADTRTMNVRLITSDLFQYLGSVPDQFDLITCIGCLHHLPVETIDEFFVLTKRRLARQGRILLGEPIDRGTNKEPYFITKWNAYSVMPERAKLIPFEESEERPISPDILLERPKTFGYKKVISSRSWDIFQHKTPASLPDKTIIPILHKLYGPTGNTQYALWEAV